MSKAKGEGWWNQWLLCHHHEARTLTRTMAVRRPWCAGEPDLVFLDKKKRTLYVAEGCLAKKVTEAELDQLAGYYYWFRAAPLELMIRALDRALCKKLLASEQNRQHWNSSGHQREKRVLTNPEALRAWLRGVESWRVVPLLILYGFGDRFQKRRKKLALYARMLGLRQVRVLQARSTGDLQFLEDL